MLSTLIFCAILLSTSAQDDIMKYVEMEAPGSYNTSTSSVQFLFFNSTNLEDMVSVSSPSQLKRNFDPKLDTVVIIHGFADYYPGSYFIPALIKGYSTLGKRNLIGVEWGELAAAPWYVTAARNTYGVGERIAEFLTDMAATKKLKITTVEMIGFSLGAHIAGVTSSKLRTKPRRIIGLDPAELLFTDSPLDFILDKSDAPLVEVVHTSGKLIGFSRPLGHRDFYPNGGENPQPGCEGITGTCSHRRAYQYFAEALMRKGKGFEGTLCSSMDDYIKGNCAGAPRLSLVNNNYNPRIKGRFYFETNPKKPYARRQG